MSYNWGPYYIVPTDVLKSYSGAVVLREEFDEELLRNETSWPPELWTTDGTSTDVMPIPVDTAIEPVEREGTNGDSLDAVVKHPG